jgi:hypothetical protein
MKCECGNDIEPWYIREYSKVIYRCMRCEIHEVDDRVFYEDFYPNDVYRGSKLHPDPRDWKCPKHEAKYTWIHTIDIGEEIRTDFNDEYIRQDPAIIESIEKSDDICKCGHIYDNHFPSWGAQPLKCKIETCNCWRYKDGDN